MDHVYKPVKHRNKLESRRSKKHRKSLEDMFKDLNKKYIKIKKRDRKRNNWILHAVLNKLLEIMRKQNKLFHSMKPKLEYLGSYFDGLRVGQPTEYDINIIFKLPVDYSKIRLDARQTPYDCTHIYMHSEFRRLSKVLATASQGFIETRKWCDNHFRLSVKMFRSWMQGVVDRAIATLPLEDNRQALFVRNKYFIIVAKTSGPACTITITEGNNVIDVDLVPTFAFVLPKRPCGSSVLFDYLEKAKLNTTYFVVPKPSEDELSWRLAFPFQERQLLNDKNNLKSAAKLLKLLRDTQGFKLLASYYIKTLFLWEAEKQNNDFWKHNSLTFLVVHMLNVLKDCLAKAEIKNFWCPRANLLENKIKIDTCHNWSNRLSVIIRNIESNERDNPNIVMEYFTNNS